MSTLVEKDKITYEMSSTKKLIQKKPLPRPGTVVMWGGATLPAGALWCNGTPNNRHTYSELYAVIGYRYGGGGDFFNTPEFRDLYLVGTSSMVNCDQQEYGNWKIQEFSHHHIVDIDALKYINSQNSDLESGNENTAKGFASTKSLGLTVRDSTYQSATTPSVTKQSYRPRYTVCNYIIYHGKNSS
jgi:microcystin-dependent protein